MPTLLDYRRRIRSVKNTQQITRAMKFIAAAKLRRAQEGVFAARPYAREILRVLRSAAARVETTVHPLLERRPEERLLLVVVTGDRGLCGAFNTNAIRRAMEFSREHASQKLQVIAAGKKGRDTLRRRAWTFAAEYMNASGKVEFSTAMEISGRIAEMYAKREVDGVYAIYNEFKNVMVQKLRTVKLLPIDPGVLAPEGKGGSPRGYAIKYGDDFGGTEVVPGSATIIDSSPSRTGNAAVAAENPAPQVDYIYEEPIEQIFSGLLPRYLDSEVFRILLESAAAESAARMVAMDSATRNASQFIDRLTLDMNKIRQAGITKELIEIVSGAASATS